MIAVQKHEQKKGGVTMSFDYSKFKGKIKENYDTQERFAKALGVSERTLSLKLNNKIAFNQLEIQKILDLLEIDEKEIPKYFFTPEVQKIEYNKPNEVG